MKCSVKNCKSSNEGKACEISFYRFPTNPALRMKWITFCHRNEKFNSKNAHICSLHFTPEDIENRRQYEMGFAKHRLLKRDAVPTVDKNSTRNHERSAQRAARIEKRENKKLVESLLEAYEVEEKAKLHEDPEANINEYVDPDSYYNLETLIDTIGIDSEFTTEHEDDTHQFMKTKATQTELMDDDEYACAFVTVTRNFLAYNLKCFYCKARFSIHDWDELMNHIGSDHRLKMESQFKESTFDKTLNQLFNFDEKSDDKTAPCHQNEENDIQNVSVLNSYSTDAYEHIDEFLKMKTERPNEKKSRKRKQSGENYSSLDFNMETSDASQVFHIIDLLHSDPTLWFIDGVKTKQYKDGMTNLYTKICEKYAFKNQKELHNCLIQIRDWYQQIFKQKKSNQLSYPQSEYYKKLAKFLPDSWNEKTCEFCERTFEDHLQYFAHKKMDHAEIDNEELEDKSLMYLKDNLTDYFHSRYRHIPPGQLYECRICFKKYNRRNVLVEHVRTHLDIRNHICHICGKAFVQKHTFAAHKRRHNGLRKSVCLICGKAFKTWTDLTFHRKRYHRPIEGTIEEIEKNTNLHRKKKVPEKLSNAYMKYAVGDQTRFACLYCEKHFAHQTGALRHYNQKHKSEMEVKEATLKEVINLIEIIDETYLTENLE